MCKLAIIAFTSNSSDVSKYKRVMIAEVDESKG